MPVRAVSPRPTRGRVLPFPTPPRDDDARGLAAGYILERGVYTAPYLAGEALIANAVAGSGARVAECIVRGDPVRVIALLEQLLDVVDPRPS